MTITATHRTPGWVYTARRYESNAASSSNSQKQRSDECWALLLLCRWPRFVEFTLGTKDPHAGHALRTMIPILSVPMLSFSLRGAAPAIKVRTFSPAIKMSMESDLAAVEQLKQQIEVLRLKQQIAEMEAMLQSPPAPAEEAVAKAAQEAAARAAEEAAAKAAEEAAAMAAQEAAAKAAEEAAARAAEEAAARAAQEAVARAVEEAAARAAQEAAALAAAPSVPDADLKAIEDLKQQIELLQLKQQLAALKGVPQAPPAAVAPVPELPVPVAEAPPAVVAAIPTPPAPIALPDPVPVPVPAVPSVPAVPVPEPPVAAWVLPTPTMEAVPAPATMVPEAFSEPVVSALQQASNAPTEAPNMAIFGALLLIPIGALGGQRFIEFVNTRYEEIGGTVGGGNYASAAAPDQFSPSSFAADAEVAAASGWDAGGRSAPEIFWAGVDNFNADPKGWWFGEPSALYSNLPPPSSAAVAAASMATAAASTDMDFVMATPLPVEPAPFEGRVVPSAAASEPTGKAARRERRAKRK